MKHPRALRDLPEVIRAVEAAGEPVAAVEVLWRTEDGKEIPVFRLIRGKIVSAQEKAGGEWTP